MKCTNAFYYVIKITQTQVFVARTLNVFFFRTAIDV